MARAKDIQKFLEDAFGGRGSMVENFSKWTPEQKQALKDSILNSVRGQSKDAGKPQDVNPNIAVNTQQYSPAQKQALWEKSGGKGNYQEDAFYRAADGALAIKPDIVIPGAGETIGDNRFLAANAPAEGMFRTVAAPAFDAAAAQQGAAAANRPYFERKGAELKQDYGRSNADLARLKAYATSTFASDFAKTNRSFATQMRQASNAYGARGLSGSGIFSQYATDAAVEQEDSLARQKAAQEKAMADYASTQQGLDWNLSRGQGDLARQEEAQVASDVQKLRDSASQSYYDQLLVSDKAPNLSGKPKGAIPQPRTVTAGEKAATYSNQSATASDYEKAMEAIKKAAALTQ